MKKEDLIKLGVDEKIVYQIFAIHGKDLEKMKSSVAQVTTERDALKTQLTEAGATIESFKAMKPDELKAAADDWKAKYEQAQTETQTQILSIKRGNALEKQLKETYKVKDVKSVKAHLDDEKIQFNEKDETFIGLDEQVKPVKEKHDYLFDSDKKIPEIVLGGNNQSIIGDPMLSAARKAAGLPAEQK